MMKTASQIRLAAGILLAATSLATAELPVRGIATVGDQQVILDVFVDAGPTALRGFGFSASFDPDQLRLVSGGRYEDLWFLRGEDGVRYPYTDLTAPRPGEARVIGGMLDGRNPEDGVGGDNLLLGTLVFERRSAGLPVIKLGLASPQPYVNFAGADGEPLDEAVSLQEVVLRSASGDSDQDGLPDDYEVKVYGDLTTSDGDTDSDHDGVSDRDEWLQGTDPTDAGSRFLLRIVPQPGGSKLVVWTGRRDALYDLEWSPDLRSFETIALGIPGNSPHVEHLDEAHNDRRQGHYRIRTRLPDPAP